MAKKTHKKALDDFLTMDKTDLDYGDLSTADSEDVVKAYELHHSKEADIGHTGLETHLMMELHGKVKDVLGGEINFQHIDNEQERKTAAGKFADEMMMFSLKKYYVHSGMTEQEAEKTAKVVLKDDKHAAMWHKKVFGAGGKQGFIDSISNFGGNLRDFIHPSNAEIYKEVYKPFIDEANPYDFRKEQLRMEVARPTRNDAIDKYFKKILGNDAEGFEIYDDTHRGFLMDLTTGVKKGVSLSKEIIAKYEEQHMKQLKKAMFKKIPDKYKK